jgi:hypothetical protein
VERVLKDGGNSGAASGADRVLEGGGAFQERPAMNAGKATRHMHYEKEPRGHRLEGRRLFRFKDRGLKGR